MANKLKILSITGGGIRGIIPAAILAYMESYINSISKSNSYIGIAELFDFVAGNSTGSIVAASSIIPAYLGSHKPRYKMQNIVDNYYSMGNNVFYSSFLHDVTTLWGLIGPRYDTKAIEYSFEKQFDNFKMGDLIKPCMFTGFDITTGHPRIYTNFDGNRKYSSYKVKDVIRASTSVPSYFKPAYFSYNNDVNTMVDGGVYANNPSLCAFIEVSKTWFDNKPPKQYNPQDVILVSIGTGYTNNKGYEYKKAKKWGKAQWMLPIISTMLSAQTEAINYQITKLFEGARCKDQFISLNPKLKYASYNFVDASQENLNNLLKDAYEYIEINKNMINKLCEQLLGNSI